MKTKYTINQESKSYLANLLATENLEVQYKKTQTASFDVQNRVLTIPIWKKDLSEPVTDLFVAHEVGHALYTPMSLLKKAQKQKINHSIVNVVEDARIEKLIKRRYNGLRQSFIRGYKELIGKNFFGTVDKDINDYLLIDRLNIHFKSSHVSSDVKFTDEEMKFVEMIEKLETPEDVIKVSKKLQAYCNVEKEEKGRDQEIDFDDHSFEEVNPDEMTDEEKENAQPVESKDSSTEEETDEENEEGKPSDNKKQDSKKDENPTSTGVSGKSDDLDQAISETDRSWESQKQNLTDSECEDNEYAYLHKFADDQIIVPYKEVIKDFEKFFADMAIRPERFYQTPQDNQEAIAASKVEYNKFKKRSLKTVMYLVKEFEQKKSAALYARASSDKTGVIDPLKLHSYKYADDVFKRLTILPDGKNHGLMLLIDWSGSMHDKIVETTEQLVQLTMFCRKINVPYEVYAFTNCMQRQGFRDRYDDNSDKVNYKLGDTRIDEDYNLIQWSSSTMNNRDFDKGLYYLYTLAKTLSDRNYRSLDYNPYSVLSYPHKYGMSSTPLNDALIHFHTLIPQFQNKYSIDKMNTILLTDGHSDRGCTRVDPTVGSRGFFPMEKNIFIVNKKTRRQYNASGRQFTNALINSLRDQTGTKIVNFYIQSRRGLDMWQHQETHGTLGQDGYRRLSPKVETLIKQQWKKDKVVIAQRDKHNTPYDEQYTINSNSMKISDEAMATPSENAKTGELKRLFSKSRNSSLQSRIVLNRFIKLVA